MSLTSNPYELSVNNATKEVELKMISSALSESEAIQFMNDFTGIVSKINANEYSLNIDASHFQVVGKALIDSLEEAFKAYKQAEFKKVIINVGDNATLNSQVHRLARNTKLTQFLTLYKGEEKPVIIF